MPGGREPRAARPNVTASCKMLLPAKCLESAGAASCTGDPQPAADDGVVSIGEEEAVQIVDVGVEGVSKLLQFRVPAISGGTPFSFATSG